MRSSSLDLRLSRVGIFVRAGLEALGLLQRPKTLVYFAPQAIVGLLLVATLAIFPRAPGTALLAPILRVLGGERALHYPGLFERLPFLFSILEAGLNGLLFAFGWAAFVRATPSLFLREPVIASESWSAVRSRWKTVLALSLPPAALHVASLGVFDEVRRAGLGESPRLLQIGEIAAFAVVALGRVVTAYTLPAAFLSDISVKRAYARSWTLATRNFRMTAAFTLLPRILEVPLRNLARDLPRWSDSIDPESCAPLVGLRFLATTIGTAVSLAALARFYLHVFGSDE